MLVYSEDDQQAGGGIDIGGGTSNTAFLVGTAGGPNAVAVEASAAFWIEQVAGENGEADFLQLQYSQQVLLNFNGLSWPHITVATLRKQVPVNVPPQYVDPDIPAEILQRIAAGQGGLIGGTGSSPTEKQVAYNKHAYYMRAMDGNFAYEVAKTAHALRRAFDRRAAAVGVTRAQWRVLAWLGREDGMRQVDLADGLDVEPITLCRMIDRLAEAGLVERRRDEEDRRAWRIHLMPAARPVIEHLRGLADEFLDEALEGVSETDQARVRDVLARVRANLAGGLGDRRRA